MGTRGWLAILGAVCLVVVAALLIAAESPWRSVPVWAFWALIAGGVVVRIVRSVRTSNARDTVRPAAQGLDEVQDLYLGRIRPTVTFSATTRAAERVEPVPDDPLAGGSIVLEVRSRPPLTEPSAPPPSRRPRP